MSLPLIQRIASQVRTDFEARRINENTLEQLYQAYNPLLDIGLFLKRAKELFPCLNCGLTTVYLKHLFRDGEIIRGKYCNNNHTFLLLEDSIIVDITSDQYGGPKVYAGPLQSPWLLG